MSTTDTLFDTEAFTVAAPRRRNEVPADHIFQVWERRLTRTFQVVTHHDTESGPVEIARGTFAECKHAAYVEVHSFRSLSYIPERYQDTVRVYIDAEITVNLWTEDAPNAGPNWEVFAEGGNGSLAVQIAAVD